MLFLSTLSLRRATANALPITSPITFLSTLSLRRATMAFCVDCLKSIYFYPRSPCGERLVGYVWACRWPDISIHALLAESDKLIACHNGQLHDFYPRSPCGERRLPTALRTPHQRFLSTLSLRRATQSSARASTFSSISIHALLAESDRKSAQNSGALLRI